MEDSHVVSITKDKILIDGKECTDNNFEQILEESNIGTKEALQIINLVISAIKQRQKNKATSRSLKR